MTQGIVCTMEYEGREQTLRSRLPQALGAALFYAALWGGLYDMAGMAGLSPALPLFLLPGLAAALAALLPGRRGIGLLATCAAAALAVAALRFPVTRDGVCVLLNRLCEASQVQQDYVYQMFPVSAPEAERFRPLGYALTVLGLLTGSLCGAARVFRLNWIYLLLLLAYGGGVAYLGVSPGTLWLLALGAALVLTLGRRGGLGPAAGVLAAGLLLWGAMLAAFPGESAVLSAWEENARDALALHTAVWTEDRRLQTPRPAPEEVERPFREEETAGGLGGAGPAWPTPPPALWVIFLLAAALFLPSFASDHLKKRRARNRAGLDDPDPAAAIRCMFLYALRWLRLGGLKVGNVPFSACGERVEETFSPEMREWFEAAVPLWQEAAYSDHRMDGEQRERMKRFVETVRQAVWSGLNRRGRLRAKYIDAL